MDTRRAPGIPFAVDKCESRVADVEPAKSIDIFHVRRLGQVEGLSADESRIVNIDGARDQGKLVFRNTTSSLEITPPVYGSASESRRRYVDIWLDLLSANLILPQAPTLCNVISRVKSRVVRREARVL